MTHMPDPEPARSSAAAPAPGDAPAAPAHLALESRSTKSTRHYIIAGTLAFGIALCLLLIVIYADGRGLVPVLLVALASITYIALERWYSNASSPDDDYKHTAIDLQVWAQGCILGFGLGILYLIGLLMVRLPPWAMKAGDSFALWWGSILLGVLFLGLALVIWAIVRVSRQD
jgi:hypothetical protein